MAKKRPEHPSIVVLPNGKRFKATVFAVLDKYEDGTPRNVRMLKEDSMVKLSENPEENQFMICYVSETHFKS